MESFSVLINLTKKQKFKPNPWKQIFIQKKLMFLVVIWLKCKIPIKLLLKFTHNF